MPIINISVRRKKAASPLAHIVCGNSDYQIAFHFDAEWDAHPTKTARFIWNGQYHDVVFTGSICDVPVVQNATICAVGVFAGDLHTTTPALIACDKSILCGDGLPADPPPDVYAQIMELLSGIDVNTAAELAGNAAASAIAAARSADLANTRANVARSYVNQANNEAVKAETAAQRASSQASSAEYYAQRAEAAGKSAYNYAQDAGYLGTEEEFAVKLATDHIDWFGVGISIPSGADLNTYKTNGKYYANSESIGKSLLNRPEGMNTNFVMWVFQRTTSSIYSQLMLTLTGKMYIRSSNSSAWRAWVAYTTSEEIETLTEEIRNQLSEDIADLTKTVEPEVDDIPKVFFGGTLPQNKTDTIMPFRYISKTQDISGFCETKAQGNSTMSYPKKNQTVKLFSDSACTEKLKVDFRGWGEQNKHCYKANWTDITHARNVVSARLWGDVVRSRSNYDDLPEQLRNSPNCGAIDGFPVKVYANGVYQGRYTLNIPKDAWMANMDKSLDTHCILCGENYVSGCFRAAANIDGTDWSDEVHDTVPASINTRWNEVISFVMNSTDAEFKQNLSNYFDVDSLIDYHLFGLASCGWDAFGKNQLYMTFDGQKWFATVYDMDYTWGLNYDGTSFVAADFPRESYQDFVANGEGNLLYIRLSALFTEEIKARWVELKTGALSIDNIINRFERFTDIASPELVAEDYAQTTAGGAFTAIPSPTTNNIQQIRAYALARLEYVNKQIFPPVNLWKISDKTAVTTVYAMPADPVPVSFDYEHYYYPATRTGMWLSYNKDNVTVVIDGEDVKLSAAGAGALGNGIFVPIQLETGATYRISYTIENYATLSIVYYGADRIYKGFREFNVEQNVGTNSVEATFTALDYPYAFVSIGAHEPQDGSVGEYSGYSNIVIEKV